MRLARALDELDQVLGHSPTVAELAAHLGLLRRRHPLTARA